MIVKPERWICEPDENNMGLLEVSVNTASCCFPLGVETKNVSPDDVTLGEEQNFNFIIEGSKVKVYSDEDAYNADKHNNMAAESIIPSGLFPPLPAEAANFKCSGTAIINCRVTETCDAPERFGFEEDDVFCTVSFLGCEMNAIFYAEVTGEEAITAGNIVSGLFWVRFCRNNMCPGFGIVNHSYSNCG